MNKMHIRVYEDSDNFVRGIQVHSFDKFFFFNFSNWIGISITVFLRKHLPSLSKETYCF